MAALSKDLIFAVSDLETEKVDVPEWGGYVIVSTMSASAKDQYEQSIVSLQNGKAVESMENIRSKLLCATVVDDEGKPLFSKSDIERLGKKSAKAIDRVFEVASRLNAISSNDVEELAKNS